MKFEWDDVKAQLNFAKHRVNFEEAQSVFVDAEIIRIVSARKASAEERDFYEEKL